MNKLQTFCLPYVKLYTAELCLSGANIQDVASLLAQVHWISHDI